MNTSLPAEIISLIHHIELNRTGWWDKAIQRLIIGVLWITKRDLTLAEIGAQLYSSFSINLSITQIETQIQALIEGDFIVQYNSCYKITEQYKTKLENERITYQNIEAETKNRFSVIVESFSLPVSSEDMWESFNSQLLLPLIYEMGARTYELISGVVLNIEKNSTFQEFLNYYNIDLHKDIIKAINVFLDPKNITVRKYILCNLQAYFLLEASNLKEEVIRKLSKSERPKFTIFSDTNFLFSILDLHDHPFNEAATYLMNLTKNLKRSIGISFNILPITLEETKKAILFSSKGIKELKLTDNLIAATLDEDLRVSNYTKNVIRDTQQSSTFLSSFDVENLLEILKLKGIKLWQDRSTNFDNLGYRQDIVDDIVSQIEFYKKFFPDRPKHYQSIKHDIILWHYINERRDENKKESPHEIEFWIVTLDNRLIGFDRYKQKSCIRPIPVCVHPITLIQLLQFWVSMTPQFEEIVLNSFKWLFLSQEFDMEAEKVTINILGILSKFEKSADLPIETVKHILINKALREKLSYNEDMESEIEYVKEALIEENKDILNRLNSETEENKHLSEIAREKETIIEGLRENVKNTSDRLEAEHKKNNDLTKRLENLEKSINIKEVENNQRKANKDFILYYASLPLILTILVGLGISYIPYYYSDISYWKISITLCFLLFIPLTYFINWNSSKNDIILQTNAFLFFNKIKNKLLAALASIFLGVLCLILRDNIYQLFNNIVSIYMK